MTAYVIADVTVTNPEGYAAYRPLAAASIAQHGRPCGRTPDAANFGAIL